MNWEGVEGNWKSFQGNILQKWSKLTGDDLNQVKGRRDALLGKLQERYGIGREAAERQIEEWVRGMEDQAVTGTKTADNITQAYEHWFASMREVQRQSIELMSERMRKAMELPARFAECGNPADIAMAQAEFTSTMVSDYFEAGREMLSVLTATKHNSAQDLGKAGGEQVPRLKASGRR